MIATGQTAELSVATAGQAGKWRAASAAVTGSVLVGFMPIVTLQLFKAGISAPSMLVWRYGLALVPLAAASAAAGHDFRAALRGGAWRIALVGATLGAGQTLCFWESLHTLDTSVPRLGPASYAVIANCELVTVILVGVLALGERLTAGRAAGAGLILCAILLHTGFSAG